jgi:CheY-like chemotaxis protein
MIEALPGEEETPAPASRIKPVVAHNARILVVDDEPTIRDLLEKVLTKMGFRVDLTADAGIALDKIHAGEIYDLIITDIRMPGMSGIELYSRIMEKAPEMKDRIVFITGDVMGVDIKTFLIQNKLPYLAKPFDIDLLKEKIGAMIEPQTENNKVES